MNPFLGWDGIKGIKEITYRDARIGLEISEGMQPWGGGGVGLPVVSPHKRINHEALGLKIQRTRMGQGTIARYALPCCTTILLLIFEIGCATASIGGFMGVGIIEIAIDKKFP